MEAIKNFLLDYLILCLRFNFQLSSCGCCNSPYLIRNKTVDFVSLYNVEIEDVYIDFENKCIEFDKDGVGYQMNVNGEVKEIKRW